MDGDYVFRAFGVDLKKAVQNISFVAACLVTALLCFTAEVYTDFSNARSYSVYEAILTLVKDALLSDISFSSIFVFGKSLSGYISMFLPVSSAFPYITNLCAERNSGNIRFSIMRTGRLKYYFSKLGSALLSGGFSTLLGVVIYGCIVFMLFPDINAYAVTAEDMLFFFPSGIAIFIAKTLIHSFLYGCISVMPAFFLSSFCRNPYIVLCVPFMVTYIWTTALNKIASNEAASGNFDAAANLQPFYPNSISNLLNLSDERLYITLAFNLIIVGILLTSYIVIMEKRFDTGC